MKYILTVFLFCLPMFIFSQESNNVNRPIRQAQEDAIFNWLKDLNKKGLEIADDSLIIGEEFQKVLMDSVYRKNFYPSIYTWEQATQFIEDMELKKAFWFFINLYPENDLNKELVIKSVLAYDQLFKMDEIMVNTFYTYSFMDPEVSVIQDGKPEIVRPDILEAKLRTVREIVGYVVAYREQKQKEATGE